MRKHKCEFPEGVTIKPDGVNELDPCVYEVVEAYTNVDIQILRCKNCGHIEFEWSKTDNTEDVTDAFTE